MAGRIARGLRLGIGLAGLLAFAGCGMLSDQGRVPARPPARPIERTAPVPSAKSAALARHYRRLQAHLLAQGLLRRDGGGVDTPYTAEDVARNFERIAFYDEYARGGGLRSARDGPGVLRRWRVPVRLRVEFGATVPQAVRDTDGPAVAAYAERLARLTRHPVTVSDRNPNFHVIIATEDDRAQTIARVRALAPGIGPATMALVKNPPRNIYCFVLTFSGTNSSDTPDTHDKAIALIRAEQPDLMRRSCIHEEMAQGLGLGNDSPTARPSIFNDDEEFALLTSHDEELLRLLYHPALRPGMSLDEARPVIRRLLDERANVPA